MPACSVNSSATCSTMCADRKSTRLNSSHLVISYAVFCLKKKKKKSNESCTFRKYSVDPCHPATYMTYELSHKLTARALYSLFLQIRPPSAASALASHAGV